MSKFIAIVAIAVLTGGAVQTQATGAETRASRYMLVSAEGLKLHNVTAEPATLEGKKGLRVTSADQRHEPLSEELATIASIEFSSGTFEAEIAGAPAPEAGEGARGFVGIAFRVQEDMRTYDAFYLRPTNGRAGDQERRNHSAQYISHPDWPWFRLRKETPSKYESYVDLVPGAWTKVKIEVNGAQARLYVHGNEQPTLIVDDLKSGAHGKGAIALWVGPGTVAHYRNLFVQPR